MDNPGICFGSNVNILGADERKRDLPKERLVPETRRCSVRLSSTPNQQATRPFGRRENSKMQGPDTVQHDSTRGKSECSVELDQQVDGTPCCSHLMRLCQRSERIAGGSFHSERASNRNAKDFSSNA
jgi:hypothetical protein